MGMGLLWWRWLQFGLDLGDNWVYGRLGRIWVVFGSNLVVFGWQLGGILGGDCVAEFWWKVLCVFARERERQKGKEK